MTASYPFPELVDNSALSGFKRCPTYWRYNVLRNLTTKGTNIHLHAGGAFAAGLEAARKAFYGEGLSEDDAIAAGIYALTQYWGTADIPEDEAKSYPRMVQALIEYFTVWRLPDDPFRPYTLANGKPAVEFTFALPIPEVLHPTTGQPLLYGGRFDMLAEHEGVIYIEDDKTASQLGPSWSKNWDLDSQFTGYAWAAKNFGIPVGGILIRGISILKGGYGTAQAITYRPQRMIDTWYENTVELLHRMLEYWRKDRYPQALDKHACNSYGGCQFSRLCQSPDPEGWIDDYYEERNWNPLSKEGS